MAAQLEPCLSFGFVLDGKSRDVYTSPMDITKLQKSAHHPERTLRAFDAVGLAPSLRLLTRKEVAEVLDVSLKVLDRLVRDGHIVRLQIGAKVRFRLSDVEAFLTGQAVA
jgi:excisionase family DNA binding protein